VGRAAACFLTVGLLVILGAGMRGNVFSSSGNDAFDSLGYLADLGTGTFYFVARSLETTGADVSHAGGDYGTRFLAAAGVLNLLAHCMRMKQREDAKHECRNGFHLSHFQSLLLFALLISIAFGFLSSGGRSTG